MATDLPVPGVKGHRSSDERTVSVFYQGEHALDTAQLILYFQDRYQSGGGPVQEVSDMGDDTYLVTFQKREDAKRVVIRNHQFYGAKIFVTPSIEDPRASIPHDKVRDQTQSIRNCKNSSETITPIKDNSSTESQAEEVIDDDYITPLAFRELNVNDAKQRYLATYHKKELDEITKKYLHKIEYSPEKIVIRGMDNVIEEAVDAIVKLLNAIGEETFSVSKPRALDFLNSSVGREKLEKIEEAFMCTVDVDEGLYACIDRQADTPIQIIHGGISLQQADVLVDTVGPDLNLSDGALSSTLLRVGGPELQRQCRKYYPGGIHYGGMVKTSGGRLNCKQVYHCCLPEWTGNNSKDLEEILYRCLCEASHSGHTSIAFPALGTGNLNYPPQIVASVMLSEIKKFQQHTTSLDTVFIVLNPDDVTTINCFKTANGTGVKDIDVDDSEVEMRSNQVYVSQGQIQIGQMSVQIKQGDITQEDTECIVNSSNIELQLRTGPLSTAISQACGNELDLQCNLKVAEMKKKGVVITTAPRLPSSYIIHVAIDHFHGNMKEIIKVCLKTAHERDMTSIAFPPLATGVGSLSVERMCKMLINTLREFGMKNTTLQEIRVVIFEKEKHKNFLLKLDEIVKQTKKEMRISRIISRKCKIKTMPKDSRRPSVGERELPDIPAPEERETTLSGDVTQEPMILCNVSSTGEEAEITIYSVHPENRKDAFEHIVDLCQQNIIKKTFQNEKIKAFNKAQLMRLREFVKDMNLNIVVYPGTERVDVEGLNDDVTGLKSYLSDMVDNLASS